MACMMRSYPRMSDATNNKDGALHHLDKLESLLAPAFMVNSSKARAFGFKTRGHEFEPSPVQIIFRLMGKP